MVTMLDAHPQVAMSYELYPNLLKFDGGTLEFVKRLRDKMARARNIKRVTALENDQWKKFVYRCPRGGINIPDLVRLLDEHIHAQQDFLDENNRLNFIARCARLKMEREGKSRWGLKCTSNFNSYLKIWPEVKILFMIRDGRDMLASKMNVGSFDVSAQSFAQSWVDNIQAFKKFSAQNPVNSLEIIYENLVTNPAETVETICNFIGAEYSSKMLVFHEYDNTLFRNPTGHLSYKQLREGLNTKSMGRWRFDLSSEIINTFTNLAGPLLAEYGYDR